MPKKKKEPEKVTRELSVLDHWTAEEIQVIKNMLAKDLQDPEFKLFLMSAKRLGADPLKREMYAQVYTDRNGRRQLTLITGIDLFRRKATSNPRFNGMTEVKYGDLVQRKVAGVMIPVPEYATIGIYLKGAEHPTYATAYFDEYVPAQENKQFMWKKMPRMMIAKCAEALAIRKSMPSELADVYTEEEGETIQNRERFVEVEKAPKQIVEEIMAQIKEKGYDIDLVCKKYKVDKLEDLDIKVAERMLVGLKAAPARQNEAQAKVNDAEVHPTPKTKTQASGAKNTPEKPSPQHKPDTSDIKDAEIVKE